MTCRACGTEIADKAIVCFRCGTPTAGRDTGVKAAGTVRSTGRLVLHRVLPFVVGLGAMLFFDSTGERLMGFAGGVALGAVVSLVWWRRAHRAGRVR